MSKVPASPNALRGDVILTTGTNFAMALIAVATGALASRLLGPNGRGQLAAIQTWPSLIATVAMLGLPDAMVYLCAREPLAAGRLFGSGTALSALAAAPLIGIGYALMPLLLAAQSSEIVAAARWYLLLVPIFLVVAMPLQPLRGLNLLMKWNILRLSAPLSWLLVLIVAWRRGEHHPTWVAAHYLLTLSLLVFPITIVLRRSIPGPYRCDSKLWPAMLRFGIPSVGSTIPQLLNLRLDQMMMAALLPARVLGLYVVAVAWSSATNPLLQALGNVLFPRVASRVSTAEQANTMAQGVRLATILSAVVSIVFLGLTPIGIPSLFGLDFFPAVVPGMILVIAGSVTGMNIVLEEGLRGLGKPAAVFWSETIGLVFTGVSLVLLLKVWGILGAALSSLLGYTATTAALLVNARHYTQCPIRQLLLPHRSDVRAVIEQVISAIPNSQVRMQLMDILS
jgi:O-antigen/teichoic acid export membrane protein